MSGLVILDSTVLSNFALVRRTNLVTTLWPGSASTTRAALDEYLSASDKSLFPPSIWINLAILDLTENEKELAQRIPARLGAGERACIAASIVRKALFVSDDLDARKVARNMQVVVSGTLGILIGCAQLGIIAWDEGTDILGRMIAAGFRSPITELKPKEK